ncbi:competence protein ComEA helix-hairpin-helix repeat protein [Desulfotomaculum nigrificans CO-1-SRB]|uniref:Competence protein ComEA helix-hairpin-helix repeat protein n=1 Tax=Desulfotomaculum nigrificans (strain DSM 14880 / VKM B-2319 / CO-1-SRB) TaxID=868595 RepID=F6B8P7_DESCC|nr:ComEA family DNA-binding protein [Desulfotomaculum nigrificans]AEF94740.1 competence protein ComEA helix-hairpin-helix repeat protein [Desulfotomaculum nigrificans CO-1-SRB]
MFNLGRKEQIIIFIVIGVILFSAGYQWAGRRADSPVEVVGTANAVANKEEVGPVVHVDGAVEKPGVYKLPPGSRVNDAVAQAVALPEADLSALNLAAPLKDGEKLVVARKGEPANAPAVAQQPVRSGAAAGSAAPTTAQKSTGLININTASSAELESLPGIGPTLANRIIQHRQANGPFQSIEDLKNVSGIGDKKFADLQHLITVQ